jgi:uncharacterized membrane protein
MQIHYNHVAGQNLDRLAAISDGVFSVAMTLLVLDVRVPQAGTIASERDLLHALGALTPRFVTYLMSFLTAGIFWVGQETQISHMERSNRNFVWIHIAFLFGVSMLPFSTALLAELIRYRVALLVYWANIAFLGMMLLVSWNYACWAKLVKPSVSDEVYVAIRRRIVVAQGMYALGAALCIFSTYWSIGFIVLMQLNYAIAPRTRASAALG